MGGRVGRRKAMGKCSMSDCTPVRFDCVHNRFFQIPLLVSLFFLSVRRVLPFLIRSIPNSYIVLRFVRYYVGLEGDRMARGRGRATLSSFRVVINNDIRRSRGCFAFSAVLPSSDLAECGETKMIRRGELETMVTIRGL